MPDISNVMICDMPVRFDTYAGCSHLCSYCFVKMKYDINKIKNNETSIALLNFINRRRKKEVIYGIFDYDIPLHWGGLSDPFQPIEIERGLSYECLKVFRDTKYPFVVSTKNALIASDKYLEVLKDCNCAVQFSAVGSSYDKLEPGASTFSQRVEAMNKISKYKRVLVRAQPLIPSVYKEFISNISKFKDAGVYGIIVEFMKYKTKKENTIKVQGDQCYPLDIILPIFNDIKNIANLKGIKVFSGENRLRQYGDGLNCCGVGDLWKCHTENLNHLLFDNLNLRECHKIKGIHSDVRGRQDTKSLVLSKSINYEQFLLLNCKDKGVMANYTLNKEAVKNIKKFVNETANNEKN